MPVYTFKCKKCQRTIDRIQKLEDSNPMCNCIKKGMRVLKPNGEELNSTNIGNSLALRDLSSDLRASNPFLQGSGKVFSKQDRIRFLDNFEKIVRLLKKRKSWAYKLFMTFYFDLIKCIWVKCIYKFTIF